jgi:hypothetical protein
LFAGGYEHVVPELEVLVDAVLVDELTEELPPLAVPEDACCSWRCRRCRRRWRRSCPW